MKRRIISIITALALCLSLCPTWAFAVEGEPDTGLCDHHPEHTGCGYVAPAEGHDCGHKHREDCYTTDEAGDEIPNCQHRHDSECGYVQADPGTPCGFVCKLCLIEDLIANLPDEVTPDNADEVRAQLDQILTLFSELTEDEQGRINLSRCYELQGALDNANAPIPLVNGDVTLTTGSKEVIFTVGECGDNCQGHTITQNVQGGVVEAAKILVESGTHDITFSRLNLSSAAVGIMPGGTMNLTLDGNNTITANSNLAGIYVPGEATLIITKESTGSLTVSGNNGAGIGGAFSAANGTSGDLNCGTVVINGGTIVAAGGGTSAGIGGGLGDYDGGNGGNITINGGTVTATGGSDANNNYGGAGIGGASGNGKTDASGCGGTLTINGGHVTLTAGAHNSTYGSAYGFGKGSRNVSNGPCELTLADASYLTLTEGTALDPKGTYTINGDPTPDMIVVPEDLIYNGKAQELDRKIYIDDTKTGSAEYFGRTFTVNASAEGWVLRDLGEVVNAGEYTAVFKKGDGEISKKFTVAQSGTQFVEDGAVKSYKDGAECSDFTASDTITVKATPTPSGKAPQKAASLTAPTAGQMAVFVGTTQVSLPADAVDGTYTMSVSAADVLAAAGGPGTGITLTARFIGNGNMADGEGTVTVNITAAAKIENDSFTTYVGESGLDAAFVKSGGNNGATITLLKDVERTEYLSIGINCILDLGGHTITCTGGTAVSTFGQANVTIQGAGEVVSASGTALDVGGNVTLKGGTFTSGGSQSAGVNVNDGDPSQITLEWWERFCFGMMGLEKRMGWGGT